MVRTAGKVDDELDILRMRLAIAKNVVNDDESSEREDISAVQRR